MKLHFLFALALCCLFSFSQDLKIPADTSLVTNHTTTIKGQSITYKAMTGFQPVWSNEGNITASLYYTYYKRTNVKEGNKRPLIISFNGGPGSASVWMHVAYTGPKVLNIDDEGYPIQPYGVKRNPNSILDVADIVYVNPVNTGYSRKIMMKDGKYADDKDFFGINADIQYLAAWINTFVTRNNRWESPNISLEKVMVVLVLWA
jgi:carboxypeptidase C (cathepsin A)